MTPRRRFLRRFARHAGNLPPRVPSAARLSRKDPVQLFRYPADRLPVFFFTLLFAVDLAVYALVQSPWLLVLYTLVGIVPKSAVCAFNHHHQHVPTFRYGALNRLLEIMYGLQTGATGDAWVLHHSMGHHVTYLDQTRDPSRWQRKDGSKMGLVEYAFATAAAAYPRSWAVGAKFPKQRRTFLAMLVLTVAIAAALVALRPLAGLCVFVLPAMISLVGTAWATYGHHAGKITGSHFEASNNVLQSAYNTWTGNLGYHTAHHYKASVHWSKLPELHRQIEHRIGPGCYAEATFPFSLFEKPQPKVEKARARAERPVLAEVPSVAPPPQGDLA